MLLHRVGVGEGCETVTEIQTPQLESSHRESFASVFTSIWSYSPHDIRQVGVSPTVPLHPAALKYYRERGYIK
jgi:TRAP-type uncharacterized transport system substrate-binding protein